ncbi:MAG: CHAT domain-containing protein [Erythrobacter sp.]
MRHILLRSLAVSTAIFAICPPVMAQERPVLLRDSFPIGDAEGVLCQVQDRSVQNPARRNMFDRSWAVVCRDSAVPVATIYAFQGLKTDPLELIREYRREAVDCSGSGPAATNDLGTTQTCKVAGSQLDWSVTRANAVNVSYIAEGFSAYDGAAQLALRSLIDNSPAPGTIDIATTSVADPFAFARVQAGTLEPQQALEEGYRRNLGGDYAEAAAYFETLQKRLEDEDKGDETRGEFLINRALQKSNLKEFAVADRLFISAEQENLGKPVSERLQRNFEAIHLINQGYFEDALERVRQPLSEGLQAAIQTEQGLTISQPIAARLNADTERARMLGFVDDLSLSPGERAEIIDAQGLQLEGTSLRIMGQRAEARRALLDSYTRAIAVRDGRVITIVRLRAQILGELAALSESEGKKGQAESYLRYAIEILETQYPERRAVSGAKARLAAFLLREGKEADALTLYREVIDESLGKRDAASGFANQLVPYFRYLAPLIEKDAGLADDYFKALQVLVRPGVAETQAILARELSASSDEAARLFRQSTDLAREIEQVRIGVKALTSAPQTGTTPGKLAELSARLAELENQQLRTQAKLGEFPEYRVISPKALTLTEFRETLQPGEAYARLAIVGQDAFMFTTDRTGAKAFRLDQPEEELNFLVDVIRSSISSTEGGRVVTYPFDIERAHALYKTLLAPIEGDLANVQHLIFEPDGALLRLPLDLLVRDQASVDAYIARADAEGGDAFDFRGVNWFGLGRTISTAVSASAFVDARNARASSAGREYLGVGRNEPVGDGNGIKALALSGNDTCGWTAREWNRPIADDELRAASNIVGREKSQVITGAQFTDDGLMAKDDLNDFRIVHFATHGLVTPPRPACPARPALLTSFGGEGSDGLLTFQEIFDLDLDADLIILSACDTAGGASIEATRAAGVGSGGGTALDGLVRSFIGAGGRAVLASHWPAPDDFDATERLMSEMFREGRTRNLGNAIRASQKRLMDEAQTSHPYYWAGFAIVGDAARPLLTPSNVAQTDDADNSEAAAE